MFEERMIYPSPDRTAMEHDPAAFNARLEAITPSAYVTPLLILLNVLVFIVTIVGGVDIFAPTTSSLLDWGANFGPRTISDGQWWRLASSMFVHVGIIHIAFNMYVLWQGGLFIERMLGNAGFLIVYMVSGLGGALVSVAWHPYVVSAGASGAIFGLYGALVGYLVIGHESIPDEVQSRLTRTALVFLGYNLVYGVLQTSTDLADHIGGLVIGFVCGLILAVPLTVDPPPARTVRNGAVLLGMGALFVGVALELPRPVDFIAETSSFGAVEKKALEAYRAGWAEARSHKLNDEQLADRIEKEVLPDWEAENRKLARLKGLPPAAQGPISTLVKYMDVRQQGWSMMVPALRAHDVKAVRTALMKENEADQLAAAMATKGTSWKP